MKKMVVIAGILLTGSNINSKHLTPRQKLIQYIFSIIVRICKYFLQIVKNKSIDLESGLIVEFENDTIPVLLDRVRVNFVLDTF